MFQCNLVNVFAPHIRNELSRWCGYVKVGMFLHINDQMYDFLLSKGYIELRRMSKMCRFTSVIWLHKVEYHDLPKSTLIGRKCICISMH